MPGPGYQDWDSKEPERPISGAPAVPTAEQEAMEARQSFTLGSILAEARRRLNAGMYQRGATLQSYNNTALLGLLTVAASEQLAARAVPPVEATAPAPLSAEPSDFEIENAISDMHMVGLHGCARTLRTLALQRASWRAALAVATADLAKVEKARAELASHACNVEAELRAATEKAEAARRDTETLRNAVLAETKELSGWSQLASVWQCCKRLDAAARSVETSNG